MPTTKYTSIRQTKMDMTIKAVSVPPTLGLGWQPSAPRWKERCRRKVGVRVDTSRVGVYQVMTGYHYDARQHQSQTGIRANK